VTEVFLAL